jgi:hypothetical protein
MDAMVRVGLRELAYGNLDSTVFHADRMDHADYAFLLEGYPRILSLAVKARQKGISAREVFFALSDLPIIKSGPIADVWRVTLSTKPWQETIRSIDSRTEMAAAMESMLAHLVDENRDEEPAPEDDPDQSDPSSTAEEDDGKAVAGVPSEDEAEEAAAIVRLLGCLKGGLDEDDPQRLIDDVTAIATKIDMHGFDAMLGWASRIVRGASRRTAGGTSEMTGYSTNRWSDRTIPQEQLAVARGDLEAMVRFAENGLIERSYESWKPMGKGPVVLLRDETGSMSHGARMDSSMKKHKEALSFEVVLADTFNKDGRDLITVAWGNRRTRKHVWGDPSYDLKNHLLSFLSAMDTKIYDALEQGLDIVRDYVDGADLLVVSDGQISDVAAVTGSESLQGRLEEFRDAGGRVWVVLIGGKLKPDTWNEALPFADAIVSLDDLQAGNTDLAAVLDGMAARVTSKKRMVE